MTEGPSHFTCPECDNEYHHSLGDYRYPRGVEKDPPLYCLSCLGVLAEKAFEARYMDEHEADS